MGTTPDRPHNERSPVASTTDEKTRGGDGAAPPRTPSGAHVADASPDTAHDTAHNAAHNAEHDAERTTEQTPGHTTDTMDRHEVLVRQKERFGGIKWGSAFFGWLTATGVAVVLTALAAAAGTAFGLATVDSTQQATDQAGQAAQNPDTVQTAGIATAIVVLVVLLLAYYCGGYVAGRMARFNGIKQGLAVWLWSVIIAIVAALVVAVAGSKYNILANINGFPRLPVDEGTVTTFGIVTALIALAAALVGALLGGLAGMRFHRKIDRADIAQGARHAG